MLSVAVCNRASGEQLDRKFRPDLAEEMDQITSDVESRFDASVAGKFRTMVDEATKLAAADVVAASNFNTDIGNANRFAQQHGHEIKFCHQRGSWIFWDGTRWRWDESGRAVALAKKTAIKILDEAQVEARAAATAPDEQAQAKHSARAAALAKWAMSSQKRDRIAAMLDLAKPDLSISTSELDADPMLLNCQNGTVDLRTGKLHQHRREDFLTKICNASYRPEAAATVFLQFLARIFRTHPTLIDFMQRAIGYAASGSTREQCLIFLYGRGANGKTTLMDAAMHALGDYAAKADPDLLMARDGSAAHPCNVADLLGRRMVVCAETNDGKRFDESRLKDLVGETRLKARFMRQDFFEFLATHKIFIYSNHKPTVRGTDHGFWRRMKLVPFVETIPDEEKDSDLLSKLKAEADGILTWIVAGAVAWHRNGLAIPQEVVAATSAYRNEMDSIGAFLAERCVEGEKTVSYAANLYAAYSAWCAASGEHVLSQRRLGTTLAERGYISSRDSYSGRSMWTGIGLKAEVSSAEGSVT